LGLTTAQYWDLTPREHHALKAVYDDMILRWAIERADYRNAHLAKDDMPWTPHDFLGDNRAKRKGEFVRSRMEAAMEDARLKMMKPGSTEGVPDWMIKAAEAQKNGAKNGG
jgi:hypothetical protein